MKRLRWICLAICATLDIVWQTARANDMSRPLGLLDSIRLTLQHNPDIRIQVKQAEISQGAAQQAAGQFDPILRAAIAQNIDNTPLNQQTHDAYLQCGLNYPS